MILQGRFAPRLTQLKKGYDSLPARPPRDAIDTPSSPAQWKEMPASSSSRRTREWILACGHARDRERLLPRFYVPLVLGYGFFALHATVRGSEFQEVGGVGRFFVFFRTLVFVVALCVPLESARNTASEAEHMRARWKRKRSGYAVRYVLHETGYRLLTVRNDLYLYLSLFLALLSFSLRKNKTLLKTMIFFLF